MDIRKKLAEIRNTEGVTRCSNITVKPGSNKMYLDFQYYDERVVVTSGYDLNFDNYKRLVNWFEDKRYDIQNGTLKFAKVFPWVSEKKKKKFTELEGRYYVYDPKSILFGEYYKKWKKNFDNRPISASKKRDYNQVLNDRILPYFKHKTFFDINGVCLQKFIESLRCRTGKNKGKPLSANRITNVLIPFRAIWREACEEYRWHLILPNPMNYIKINRIIPKRRKIIKNREGFRFDEWIKLMNNMDPHYRNIAEFMIMTGMIGSEIAGLRKKDIADGTIRIRNSIVRYEQSEDLKTEYRTRDLPITKAIRKLLDYALFNNDSEYVFLMKKNGNSFKDRPNTFNVDTFRKNAWTSAINKAGIQYRVPYSTRHSYAAWSLAIGVHPNKLVNRMGHASKAMVYEVYGRYIKGLDQDSDKIRSYFGSDFH